MLIPPFFAPAANLVGYVSLGAGGILFNQVSWSNVSFAQWSLSLCVNMYLSHSSLVAVSLNF